MWKSRGFRVWKKKGDRSLIELGSIAIWCEIKGMLHGVTP